MKPPLAIVVKDALQPSGTGSVTLQGWLGSKLDSCLKHRVMAQDCIELFEEYGWDWSYHAYREWDGWSVEHGSDPKDNRPTTRPTDRKRLLLEWFAKNQRPPI